MLEGEAPSNITVMPNPASAGALTSHGGTGAATPFVSGVVAKAADLADVGVDRQPEG